MLLTSCSLEIIDLGCFIVTSLPLVFGLQAKNRARLVYCHHIVCGCDSTATTEEPSHTGLLLSHGLRL